MAGLFDPERVRNAPLSSVVDEGEYGVKIVKAGIGRSKQKGTPSLDIEASIEYGNPQIDGRNVEGKHLFYKIYFADGNRDISERAVKVLCQATGVEIGTDEEIVEALPGRECIFVVKHREYNGEKQEEVKAVKPPRI